MRFFKFILSLLITAGLVYFLGKPITVEGEKATTLPPMGSFFSPFTGFWQNAETENAEQFKDFEIPEMKGKVTVHFDERMVPHIFCRQLGRCFVRTRVCRGWDAAVANGFIEQDRQWKAIGGNGRGFTKSRQTE